MKNKIFFAILFACIAVLSCNNKKETQNQTTDVSNKTEEILSTHHSKGKTFNDNKSLKDSLLSVRYHNYANYRNSLITGTIEKKCTEEETIGYFREMPKDNFSFLTITFSKTQAIQFAWQTEENCLVEITNDGNDRIFMQRYASAEECIDIIKATYKGDPNKAEGFLPVPIMEKTLDDVLSEKGL